MVLFDIYQLGERLFASLRDLGAFFSRDIYGPIIDTMVYFIYEQLGIDADPASRSVIGFLIGAGLPLLLGVRLANFLNPVK